MTTLKLQNIHEDNPRDFLAALGLLRLIDTSWPELETALSWSDHCPILRFSGQLSETWSEELTLALQALASAPENPLFHGDVIKTSAGNFRAAIRNAQGFPEKSDSPLKKIPALLYAAYSSQLTDDSGEYVIPTAFSFCNGQGGKKLLLDVSQLISSLNPFEFQETMVGTAKPKDAKSFRWNPSEYQVASYRSHDPGSGISGDINYDFPALNILAFIGLSFFPSVPQNKNGNTLGMAKDAKKRFFRWPVWGELLVPSEISIILGSDIVNTGDRNSCLSLGIERAWESPRFTDDKGNTYFLRSRPAFV